MSGPRGPRRWQFVVVAGLLALVAGPGVAGAHEATSGGDLPVSFVVVVAVTVVGSVLAGAVVVAAASERGTARVAGHLGRAVGVALVVLGLSYAVAAVGDDPVLGVVGTAAGGVVAHRLSSRAAHAPARATFGVVTAHRTVEGFALAAVYVAGSALGLLAVLLVVGHSALETCAVGALSAPAGRLRALVAVGTVHVGFLVGAVIGFVTVTTLPTWLDAAVLALGGGALLVIGLDDLIADHEATPGGSGPPSVPGYRR